jgi:pimeloyl-ACP methyl ester carboxylesterase
MAPRGDVTIPKQVPSGAAMLLNVARCGEGRPLLILPAFGLDHCAMAGVVEPVFAGTNGWMRLYVDLPGTGGSRSGEPRSDAVLDAVVRTMGSTLGRRRFAVVGWSYGGYLAAGLARRRPQQLAGLMMVCTGLKIRPDDRNLHGVLPSSPEPDWLSDVPPRLHDHFTHAIGRQTADVACRVTAALALNGPTDDDYLAALRAEGFALTDEGMTTAAGRPVSFLVGRHDRVAGYVGLFEALDEFQDADYAAAGNAGHYLPLEVPRFFKTAVLSWLDQCVTSAPTNPGDA